MATSGRHTCESGAACSLLPGGGAPEGGSVDLSQRAFLTEATSGGSDRLYLLRRSNALVCSCVHSCIIPAIGCPQLQLATMPSRKSQSSDAAPSSASRRSSMQRLSSIASFQQLNPFNRRRSNNATDNTTASSSNVSLPPSILTTTTTTTTTESRKPSASSSQLFTDPGNTAEHASSETQASFLRRSSYVCLPDDPIGGMPRSRTFSNLPLPARAKKVVPKAPSVSYSRHDSGLIPNTRLPTPPASTRRHVSSTFQAAAERAQGTKNRMTRSDTMPLLVGSSEHLSAAHSRLAAFKENIAFSPSNALPEAPQFDETDFATSLPPGSYLEDRTWSPETVTSLPRDRSFRGALPTSRYTVESNTSHGRHLRYSSPVCKPSHDHHSLSSFSRPQPAQRWNSQPVLTSHTNLHNAGTRHEIKQTRLMSARQAPTPPPPRAPLNTQALDAGPSRLRGTSLSSTNQLHLRDSSKGSLLNSLSSPNLLPPVLPGQVTTAEPAAYWCGRISALLDRYRNEDLASSIPSPSKPSFTRAKSETDKLHTPAANTARLRRALEHLHSQCLTEEARDSFVKFQTQFAAAQNQPELARPIAGPRFAGVGRSSEEGRSRKSIEVVRSQDGANDFRNSVGRSHRGVRKISLFDRVLGRREKRSSNG